MAGLKVNSDRSPDRRRCSDDSPVTAPDSTDHSAAQAAPGAAPRRSACGAPRDTPHDAPRPAATHAPARAAPRRHLGVWHAVSVCVGMVVGAGIFKTSPIVAANLGSDHALYAAWALGGLLSFAGALCFAEMAAAFPDPGGDYHFLRRAFGRRAGYLFAWSRFAVIHTGSMALLAFVFGDYMAQVLPALLAGPYASPACAAGVVAALVGLNLAGVRLGLLTQMGLMALVVGGLLLVGAAGAAQVLNGIAPLTPPALPDPARVHWGTALVFVFLAYGGWNDAATLSAEMRDARRGILRALLLGLALVTALYLLANWAYLQGLGLDGLARSRAPAADLARLAFGRGGELVMVAIVSMASIAVMNACLIAGARTTYAAVRDLEIDLESDHGQGGPAGEPPMRGAQAPTLARGPAPAPSHALSRWHAERGTPPYAVAAIGAVALALVGLGTLTRGGFATMVDYLSPVYWAFFCASAAALVVLRLREGDAPRPFRVPWYPLLPLAFCACSAYLLWSSLVFVQVGALVGVGVLALGALWLWPLTRPRHGKPRQ
jgi:amino acid transporter